MSAKIAGLFLVAFSSVSCGFFFAARYGSRLRQWEGFLRLIELIACRISGYASPLSEIYRDFGDRELENCGFINELQQSDLGEALRSCSGLDRRGEGYSIMLAFAAQLGRGGVDEQLAHCRYYGKKMQEAVESMRKKKPQTTRLCFSVCGAVGLTVDLLLL